MQSFGEKVFQHALCEFRGAHVFEARESQKRAMHVMIEPDANIFSWERHLAPDIGSEGGERHHASACGMDAASELRTRLSPAPIRAAHELVDVIHLRPRPVYELLAAFALGEREEIFTQIHTLRLSISAKLCN